MIVADRLRRNRKITITTSAIVSMSVNCTSLTEARIVVVRSMITSTLTAGRHGGLQLRQDGFDPVGGLDHVGGGLLHGPIG